jgi:hypothetical protein
MSEDDPKSASPVGYEFSDEENQVIGRCGQRVRLWGLTALLIGTVAGALTMFGFIFGGKVVVLLVGLPITFVYLLVGNDYRAAGASMERIVLTEGLDVDHLLSSIGDLSHAFKIETAVTLLTVAATIAGVAVTTGFIIG